MSETRRRKIYAGYYDRYDRKPFYVVCEAADYDTGEVNIIMQEYAIYLQIRKCDIMLAHCDMRFARVS